MNEATIAQTIMTLLILFIFIGFLVWGIKSGQFHNVEDPKFRIFGKHRHDQDEKQGQSDKGERDD
jgi:cbb3-type cytochrome oxidase maturation protein